MQLNVDWLKEWLDVDASADEIADALTLAGLEVDAVRAAAPADYGVRIAEVTALRPHPKAERLLLARVSTGDAVQEVVCGAPNVAEGIKVAFAPVGTVFPDGRRIETAEIRGVASSGMLCSARELGLYDDAAGLLVLDADAVPGTPLQAHLRLDDHVLDVDLTPNRGDCFSVLGIARDLAARLGSALIGPRLAPVTAAIGDAFTVELIDEAACPRFASRIVRGLATDARSPDWLKERLRRAGLRSIHPVVDVTNYVMLELGQPLHAYRLDRLEGAIRVRFGRAGETLELLDGNEVELEPDVLAITDDTGPIGLAGIMGGASTAVDASSADILLESAFFAPDAVQGRARRYGLHTDASVRFERGVDPVHQERAIERATELLLEIAGGAPGPTVLVESAAHVPKRPGIHLHHERVESLLGTAVTPADVEDWLKRLEMKVAAKGTDWVVTPPSHRFDVSIEEDLIEELGRMIGYDNIEPTPGSAPVHLGAANERAVEDDELRDLLVARGYAEVITYGFTDEAAQAAVVPDGSPVRLANPISADLGVLRRSLWPGLLRIAQQNLSRQQARCRLFEIGTEFDLAAGEIRESTVLAGLAVGSAWPEHWDSAERDVDFFDVKADVEAALALTRSARDFEFAAASHASLSPASSAAIHRRGQVIGWIGSLSPRLQRDFDLRKEVVLFSIQVDGGIEASIPEFEPVSRYPSVRRDLAVVVDETVAVAALSKVVEESLGDYLSRLIVFDLYRGQGIGSRRKSIGLGLILQDASRTLTDDDADGLVAAVVRRLEHELGATIRT